LEEIIDIDVESQPPAQTTPLPPVDYGSVVYHATFFHDRPLKRRASDPVDPLSLPQAAFPRSQSQQEIQRLFHQQQTLEDFDAFSAARRMQIRELLVWREANARFIENRRQAAQQAFAFQGLESTAIDTLRQVTCPPGLTFQSPVRFLKYLFVHILMGTHPPTP